MLKLLLFPVIALLMVSLTAEDDLARNGSFEQGFKNWDYPHWERKPEPGRITTENIYGGKFAYEMTQAEEGSNYIYTSLQVKPETSYQLTMYLRAEGMPERDAVLRLLRFRKKADGKSETRGYVDLPPGSGVNSLIVTGGSHPWKKYELYLDESCFPADISHVNLILSRKENSKGILGVDEVSFRAVPRQEKAQAAVPAQANLWPGDSSFETSAWPFSLPRDRSEHFHGEYSLRLDPEVRESSFHYLVNVMNSAQPYTVSFYARASAPCNLEFVAKNEYYQTSGRKIFPLGPEWRLCSLPLSANHGRSLALQLERQGEATVHLDSFSLTEGAGAPNAFAAVPELALGVAESEEPLEIYFTGTAPVERSVALRNNSRSEKQFELEIGLDAPFQERREIARRKLKLAPGARFDEKFTILPERIQGYYVIRLAAIDSNGGKMEASSPFTVTAPPLPPDEESMFGLHNGNYDAYRRIGMSFVRHFRNWSFWPYRDGKYVVDDDSTSIFNLKRPFQPYGIHHMETLFVAEAPPRLKKKDDPNVPFEEMAKYVDAMVEATRGTSRYYEIENEPHLIFPTVFRTDLLSSAKIYAGLVNQLAPRIRKLNPKAKIMAAGVGLRGDSNFDFIRTVLEIAGKEIDILPIHPYAGARYINAEFSDIGPDDIDTYARTLKLREMIRGMGFDQDIWFGEVGWALDVNEDYLSDSAIRQAAYLSRLMLLSKAAGVKKVLYFLGDHHIEKIKFYYGIWRVKRPLPATLAYAASAQFLEGSTFGEMILDSDIHVFTYRDRDGKIFAALWLSGNHKAKARLAISPDRVELRDLFNRPVQLNGKSLEIELSGNPVYLMAAGIPEQEFVKALKDAKYDLPPVKIGWQLERVDQLVVTLENLRTVALQGEFQVEKLNDGLRQFSLAPGESARLRFQLPERPGQRTFRLTGKSNQGEFSSEYHIELLSCPQFTPQFDAARQLPSTGRLPAMRDRTFLLPNDPGNGWDGPQNLSVESSICYDMENLYLFADVRDDVHYQTQKPGSLWRDDAIQLGIDTRANALPGVYTYAADDYEFGFALAADGSPQKELTYVYELGRAKEILEEVRFSASRQGDITAYRIAIPWKTLQVKPEKGMVFGLNFIVNDNDGHGARFYMGLTPGIVEVKNPYTYRKFTLD